MKEELSYRIRADVTSQRGRIFHYLNSLGRQEKNAKIYEALEKYYLPEALEYEGWRDREDKTVKITECAETLKAKAKTMYQMIGKKDEEDYEDETSISIKQTDNTPPTKDDEDDEDDEDEDDKGTKKTRRFDMDDPNVWIPDRDRKKDTGALQELLDSI